MILIQFTRFAVQATIDNGTILVFDVGNKFYIEVDIDAGFLKHNPGLEPERPTVAAIDSN